MGVLLYIVYLYYWLLTKLWTSHRNVFLISIDTASMMVSVATEQLHGQDRAEQFV